MYQKSSGKVKGTDEYMFTDNIAQKKTPVKRPYIRQEVVDIVTGKAFQRQAQTPWASNEKEELMKQRQDLRRAQFQQRTQQMGLGQKQVPNLNDIFQQQKRQQQIKQQQMEEEEMEHGMSM